MKRIYFDNNATTQVSSAVRDAMLPYLEDRFGNPSSAHRIGEQAKSGVDIARDQIASFIKAPPQRIVFTSGGSESNNMAIWSAITAHPDRKHIIASRVEHPSVLEPLKFLAGHGYTIDLMDVDDKGGVDLDVLANGIRPDTVLVSLMGANNETGVMWPLDKIGQICREKSVLFHCDGVQLAGKVSLDLERLPVDYFSLAAHKMHGPKGVGALYVTRTAPVQPVIMGASQELGRRSGTENTAGIAGFGKACELAEQNVGVYQDQVSVLRNRLEQGILEQISDVLINGCIMPRLPNTINACFKYCSSAALVQELDEKGIAVSGHSACHSGDLNPSHVLAAMHLPETYLHGSLRISLSRFSTQQEVDRFLDILPRIVDKTRQCFAA